MNLGKFMNKVYESTVEYNTDFGEYFITLPEEFIDNLGWEDGDTIEWHVNKDGTVLVERVDTFFDEEEDGQS